MLYVNTFLVKYKVSNELSNNNVEILLLSDQHLFWSDISFEMLVLSIRLQGIVVYDPSSLEI